MFTLYEQWICSTKLPSLSQVPLSHELTQGKEGAATASGTSASGGIEGKANDKHAEDLTEKNKA